MCAHYLNEGCHASSAAGAIRPAGPRANGGSGPGTRDGEAATAPCGDWSARGDAKTLVGLFLEAMTRQRSSFAPGVAPGRSHGRTYCRSGWLERHTWRTWQASTLMRHNIEASNCSEVRQLPLAPNPTLATFQAHHTPGPRAL